MHYGVHELLESQTFKIMQAKFQFTITYVLRTDIYTFVPTVIFLDGRPSLLLFYYYIHARAIRQEPRQALNSSAKILALA